MSVPPFSLRRLSEERSLLTPMKVEGHPPICTELRRGCRRGVPDEALLHIPSEAFSSRTVRMCGSGLLSSDVALRTPPP